jgi:hypothetical protein
MVGPGPVGVGRAGHAWSVARLGLREVGILD